MCCSFVVFCKVLVVCLLWLQEFLRLVEVMRIELVAGLCVGK